MENNNKKLTPISEALEILKSKVVNCGNSTAIFSTQDYVKLDDVINILEIAKDQEKEAIEESFHEGQKTILIIVKHAFGADKVKGTLEEMRKIDSGEESNEDATNYYNTKYKQ